MEVLTIDEAINETKNKNLLNLIKKNPKLPVIPLVDYEIVCEDYGRWLGSFGECYVGEFAIYGDRYYTDRDDFKENYYDRNDDELCERFNYDPFEKNEQNETALENYLNEVAEKYFTSAIIVNIDLPDITVAEVD